MDCSELTAQASPLSSASSPRCKRHILSELGENSVVLLSTHIVDDVSELCTRMAIIDRGEILLEAEPLRAVSELRGRIWRRVISKAELSAVEQDAEADFEDVYFTTMSGHIGRRANSAMSASAS